MTARGQSEEMEVGVNNFVGDTMTLAGGDESWKH
jgi:hypothetical protein